MEAQGKPQEVSKCNYALIRLAGIIRSNAEENEPALPIH
jgi:hypothetical protein